MKKSILALVLAAGVVTFAGGGSDAEAARTVRLRASGVTRASGRLRLQRHRGRLYVSGRFTRLAHRASYRLRWDGVGVDGAEFITDRLGRATLRRTEVPDGAANATGTLSVRDSGDESVFACSIRRDARGRNAFGPDDSARDDDRPSGGGDGTGSGGSDDRGGGTDRSGGNSAGDGTASGGSDGTTTRR